MRYLDGVMTSDAAENIEKAQSQLRKGLLEFCILLIIDRTPRIYAPDMLRRLRDVDMVVVEGTIYPLLSRLKREELLEYAWEESKSGPPRKLYSLTKSGKAALKAHLDSWNSLVKSISTLLS
jgi:PadR family transcriptional regulator PadR